MGFQVEPEHNDVIEAAAELKGVNKATYMRSMVVAQAHVDMGMQPPDMETAYGRRDVIKEAATALGMSVGEFTKRAAREAALRIGEMGRKG
jgi:uncharacterized protein (DUF1778 family)